MRHRFILADVETTGLTASDGVCEVAYAEINEHFEIVSEDCALINPGVPIHYAASAVNGITDEMVASAPTLDQYMESVGYPLMGDDVVLVAHNAKFDSRFLKPYMSDASLTLCTLKIGRHLYPGALNHKQATLASMLGLKVVREKAHSADGDLDVLRQMLQRMCQDAECGLEDLLHIQAMPMKVTHLRIGRKHYGKKIEDVPLDYVQWVLREWKDLDQDLRATLSALCTTPSQ